MSKLIEFLIYAVLLVIMAVVLIGTYGKYTDCQAIHGTLVRGLFGWECLK